MNYIATINLDYSQTRIKDYNRLLVALEHSGWDYVETSAMVYEGPDLDPIRRAFDLLARSIHLGGNLSALSIQVQLIGTARPAPPTLNRVNAYNTLTGLPAPTAPYDGPPFGAK